MSPNEFLVNLNRTLVIKNAKIRVNFKIEQLKHYLKI
jgi:hypothetical protein